VELTVDVESPVPVYEQIRAQMTELVESGTVAANAPLPSVRQLAADLQIAPGTVARAYRELEASGIVVCSRWAGTRVADVTPVERVERKRRLEETVMRMVSAARRLGARDEEIEAAIARALARTGSHR
jgi:GntR family transcriptional regulator